MTIKIVTRFLIALQLHLVKKIPLPLSGLMVGLSIWWICTTPLWHRDLMLVDFSLERCIVSLFQLFNSHSIFPHIFASLRRVLVGLLIAISLGVPMGIFLGMYRLAYSELAAVIVIIGLIGYFLDAVLRFTHQRWTHLV